MTIQAGKEHHEIALAVAGGFDI